MTAGAAQPDAVPGIEDFTVRRLEEQETCDRHAIGAKPWLIALDDLTATDNPFGMLTTAAQWPPARDPIAAVHDDGFPNGTKRSGRLDMRIASENNPRRVSRQVTAENTVLSAKRHAPSGGAIDARDFLDDPNQRHRIGFLASKRTRNPQAKQPFPRDRLDQRGRLPPIDLVLFRGCTNKRRQSLGGVDEV